MNGLLIGTLSTLLSFTVLSSQLGNAIPMTSRQAKTIPATKLCRQGTWQKVELDRFSFCLPPGMTPIEAKGFHSEIWRYRSSSLELTIELGAYSGLPSEIKGQPAYREERVTINGKRATVVSYRDDESEELKYVAAVF